MRSSCVANMWCAASVSRRRSLNAEGSELIWGLPKIRGPDVDPNLQLSLQAQAEKGHPNVQKQPFRVGVLQLLMIPAWRDLDYSRSCE